MIELLQAFQDEAGLDHVSMHGSSDADHPRFETNDRAFGRTADSS